MASTSRHPALQNDTATMSQSRFRFGDWWVNPGTNTLSNQDGETHLEPRAMDVLLALCEAPGQILSAEDLLRRCWGNTLHGDNPVHKTLAILRRALGDQASRPRYIATIRKRGYHTVADVIRENQAHPLRAWSGESPFCGLAPFSQERAAVFFGRQRALQQLQNLLRQRLQASSGAREADEQNTLRSSPQASAGPETGETAGSPCFELILVLGPSGAGKTSLIQAGLIPQLSHDPEAPVQCRAWSKLDLAEVGPVDCFTSLGSCLLDWQEDDPQAQLFGRISAQALGQQLQAQDHTWRWPAPATRPASHSKQRSLSTTPDQPQRPQRYLLFVDRLEALFHSESIPSQQARRLLQILAELASSGEVVVILACRNDFYPQLGQFPLLRAAQQAQAQYDLGPPNAAEIAQMIRLPAAAAGLHFDTDSAGARLDDVLCQDARHSPDALPLLQYTLHELYRSRTEDGALCSTHYHQLGGLDGAIRQRAETLMAQLDPEQQAALPQVLALVATISPSDGAITSHRAAWSALPNQAAHTLVQALVESRLFVSDLRAGVPGFSIAHEALLRSWPRALEWIAAHRDALRNRARLELHSQRWEESQRRPDLLLPPGLQLEEALSLRHQQSIQLKDSTRALIEASAARARRQALRRKAALGTILALAFIAAVFAVLAGRSQDLARQRQEQAEGLLSYMLGEFAESLRPLGRLDLLDSVSSRALVFFAQTEDESPGPQARWQRARALQVIGEVSLARGQSDRAQSAYSAAHALLAELAASHLAAADQRNGEFNQRQILQDLGINAFWLGKLRMDHGDWIGSEAYFNSYLASSQQLVELEPDNNEWWIELSYAHNNLGSLALKQAQFERARAAFARSIEIKASTLARDSDNAVLSAELADSLSWLGALEESQAHFGAAQDLYQRELALIEQLRQRAPQDTRWQNRQALAQLHQGELLFARGEWQASQQAFKQAAQNMTELSQKEPANRTWQRTQAYTRLWLLRLQMRELWAENRPDHAAILAQQLEQRLFALEQLSTELLSLDAQRLEWQRLAAAIRQYQARLALWRGELATAELSLDHAIRDLNQVLNQQSEDIQARQLQAEAYLLLATIQQRRGQEDAQRAYCELALSSLDENTAESHDYHVLVPWLHAQRCLQVEQSEPGSDWLHIKEHLQQQGYYEWEDWLNPPAHH